MDSLERRMNDAKLGAAIDNAVENLPEGYSVSVTLDFDGARAVLSRRDVGTVFAPDVTMSLAYQLVRCLHAAVEHVAARMNRESDLGLSDGHEA